MQTPKAKPGSLEVPQRKSPVTPRTARQLKTPGSVPDSVSSPNLASRISKDRSPKVMERKSPRSPVVEKKRPSRVSELELQLVQLQNDLKKVKDQLTASESEKKWSQQEAEESKKHLSAISAKLEESQQQLIDLTASEDARVQELRKISHDRDKAWQSELEAVQKQHSMDSASLASAMNEIQKLKNQLEMVAGSEASHTKHAESAHTELQSLRVELTETLTLVEKLRSELSNCRDSESQALELVSETKKQLEAANATMETLRSESIKAIGTYNSLSSDLERSKSHAKSLEQLVSKLQGNPTKGRENLSNADDVQDVQQNGENEESRKLRTDLKSLKSEVAQLKAALEASESRYEEEYIQSTLQIRSAYEQFEQTKLESGRREAELEAELKKAQTHIEDLKANLIDKETELQSVSEENKDLNLQVEKNLPSDRESQVTLSIEKVQNDLADLKANLLEKETQLQSVTEQNEMLKTEIMKGETERTQENGEALAVAEAARAAEKEALMKLEHIMEEADKSCKKAARVTEQLDAAQAANTEMEAELRKLKVQSDQWRKAAEAAAAMLSTGNNGKLVERTGSLDSSYNTVGRTLGSPYCDDMGDESPKKKNANMLKKIGVLWKKNQK